MGNAKKLQSISLKSGLANIYFYSIYVTVKKFHQSAEILDIKKNFPLAKKIGN